MTDTPAAGGPPAGNPYGIQMPDPLTDEQLAYDDPHPDGPEWYIEPGDGGWACLHTTGVGPLKLPGPLYLRLVPDELGRLRVHQLFLDGRAPLTAALLRAIPLGAVESACNGPAMREGLGRPSGADQLGAVARTYRTSTTRPAPPAPPATPRPPLRRPEGGLRLPDAFFREVADAYREAVQARRAPAPALAAEAGVPPSAVRRWVREARSRGFLPPSTHGRAG